MLSPLQEQTKIYLPQEHKDIFKGEKGVSVN